MAALSCLEQTLRLGRVGGLFGVEQNHPVAVLQEVRLQQCRIGSLCDPFPAFARIRKELVTLKEHVQGYLP